MSTELQNRTVSYGRDHVLQTISVTEIDSHPDGYWVMYDRRFKTTLPRCPKNVYS